MPNEEHEQGSFNCRALTDTALVVHGGQVDIQSVDTGRRSINPAPCEQPFEKVCRLDKNGLFEYTY